jgi:hypothetical protein
MPARAVVVLTELVDPCDHFEPDHEARVDLLSKLVREGPAERLDRRPRVDLARLGFERANRGATVYPRGVIDSVVLKNLGACLDSCSSSKSILSATGLHSGHPVRGQSSR